jgi:hypothetical protein
MLISNSTNPHKGVLNSLLRECHGTLFIASPYLAETMGAFLEEFDFSNVTHIDLMTTLKPNDPEQLTKPFQLKDFFDHFKSKYPKTQVHVHIDNHLHGKLYILGKTNRKMIITSANFTNKGMVGNHEFGHLIDNDTLIQQTLDELQKCIEYKELSYEQIQKACLFSETYRTQNPDWIKTPSIQCDILKTVCADTDPKNVSPKYYLKPLGDLKKEPINWDSQRDFSELNQRIHFKKAPEGIRKGDVIITTAIGCGALLSYFYVTLGPKKMTSLELKKEPRCERWSWYVEGRNQSPIFVKKWSVAKLNRDDLSNEFIELYPDIALTKAGNKIVPIILQCGYAQLTKEFGEFLISRINEHNC